MRLAEIHQSRRGPLTPDEAAHMVADDDGLFGAVANYVGNFEEGLAAEPTLLGQFLAILRRTPKQLPRSPLWRGDCRGDNWKSHFNRGFHSWSMNLDTARYFLNDCVSREGARLLMINKPVRSISLAEIVDQRMRIRRESHYTGMQAEVFVLDTDAKKAAIEVAPHRAEVAARNAQMLRQ